MGKLYVDSIRSYVDNRELWELDAANQKKIYNIGIRYIDNWKISYRQ